MKPYFVIDRKYLPVSLPLVPTLVWILFFDRFVPYGWWTPAFFTMYGLFAAVATYATFKQTLVHPTEVPKRDGP